MTGGDDALVTSEIVNSTNNLTITAQGSIDLLHNAQIRNLGGSGILSITTGNSLKIYSSSDIINTSTGATNLTITDNLSIESSSGDAYIQSTGLINGSIGGDLSILSTSSAEAYISSSDSINITLDNMFLQGNDAFAYITTSSGNIEIQALENINIYDNAYISNTGAGTINLVVDQLNPASPNIGSGKFYMTYLAQITTDGGSVGIFTARPTQNISLGTINTAGLTPAREQYGIWYDAYAGTGGNPFTIFYKTTAPSETVPDAFTLAFINAEGALMYNDFYDYLSPIVTYYSLRAAIEEIIDKKDFYYKILPYEIYHIFKKRYSGIKLHTYMDK